MACLSPYSLCPEALLQQPFPHFLAAGVLHATLANDLLAWLEACAPWRLVEEDFYEQHELSLSDVGLPGPLSALLSGKALLELRDTMAGIFSTRLSDAVELSAHKLEEGQSIRIHNDVLDGAATHRLVIHLNREWTDDHGGLLVLFGSEDPADIASIVKPLHNTAFGFAVSRASNHAVSRVHQGQRYTLVYSFKAGRQ